MRTAKIYVVTIAAAISAGCATGTYSPPAQADKSATKNEAIINKPFDSAWEVLIDHTSSKFFSIDKFEKASGLITLSFGSSEPEKFIDCGRFVAEAPGRRIDEQYVNYLANRGATLSGKMNIVMRQINASSSQIKINARYIFNSPSGSASANNIWSFDSGSEATIVVNNPINGTPPTRTCRPTNFAEQSIIDALNK